MSRRKKAPVLNPKRAVAYIRVSTNEQDLGPEAQRAAIAAWAGREGVELVAEREDHGVSGTTPVAKRPGLLAALDDLRALNAGLLVAAKRDRLARNVIIAATVEHMAGKAGARVVTADGVSSADTPEGALMRTLMDAFAEYERAVIAARTTSALAVKRARGERVGAVPYGYELDPDSRVRSSKSGLPGGLRPCAREHSIFAEAKRLKAKGLDCKAIADELNRRGMKNRGKGWGQSGIWRLLNARPLGLACKKTTEQAS